MEFTSVIYIDSSDFKAEDVKGYFGLAPGKTVRLLHGYGTHATLAPPAAPAPAPAPALPLIVMYS